MMDDTGQEKAQLRLRCLLHRAECHLLLESVGHKDRLHCCQTTTDPHHQPHKARDDLHSAVKQGARSRFPEVLERLNGMVEKQADQLLCNASGEWLSVLCPSAWSNGVAVSSLQGRWEEAHSLYSR